MELILTVGFQEEIVEVQVVVVMEAVVVAAAVVAVEVVTDTINNKKTASFENETVFPGYKVSVV